MWRVLGTGLFLIPIAIRCWLMKKAWPSYKGYAWLSVIRLALVMGIGIAALWGVTKVVLIVIMFLFGVSFLVPATRPKLNG
jgi:presenilin-like A22 family membrane protease